MDSSSSKYGALITGSYNRCCTLYICIAITYIYQSMDQPGKVANSALRGQLNRENENLVSRDGFDSPVPSSPY